MMKLKIFKAATTQTEVKEIPKFSHRKLDDANSYIRLLNVRSFDGSRPIPVHCELTTWPISQAPKYRAISYTWGDANNPATILVNGARMHISQNCEFVLKQATWYSRDFRDRYYWVDAVCIDQSSNEEKGPQVALMGQVYRNAERVLACVGESDATSESLYRRLRWSNSHMERLGLLDELHRVGPRDPSESATTWGKLCKELGTFLRRPYFSRVWVYQEVFLGRKVSICSGKRHFSIRSLRGLVMLTIWTSWPLPWTRPPWTIFKRTVRLSKDWNGEEVDDVTLEALRSLLRVAAFDPEPTTFLSASFQITKFKCADPRDRVYGILSTVDWSEKSPIRPDYTKDRLEIALEAIQVASTETLDQCDSSMKVAEVITRNLDLFDHPSARLEEAIQERQRLKPSSRQLTDLDQSLWRKHEKCCGARLECEDGVWKFDKPARTSSAFPLPKYFLTTPQQHLEYLESRKTRAASDEYAIFLPSTVRSGDWCLADCDHWVLIARPERDGRFEIVGNGYKEVTTSQIWGWKFPPFEIYFGAEDAIVFLSTFRRTVEDITLLDPNTSWKFERGDSNVPSSEKLAKYIEARVCGQPGSSYAVQREPVFGSFVDDVAA